MAKKVVSHDIDDKGKVHLINEKKGSPYHEGTIKDGKIASIRGTIKALRGK